MSSQESKTRINLLQTTMQLMEQHAGKGVRMSDIAKAAGVSRQAVYLHFKSRTELMVAAVKYGDVVKEIDKRRQPWIAATTGVERLRAYIKFWGNYLPEIHGLAKALMVAMETDEAAAAAWDDRMNDLRSGCRITIEMLASEKMLVDGFSTEVATDLFWTLLSVRNWEQLTVNAGWSNEQYIEHLQTFAARAFIRA